MPRKPKPPGERLILALAAAGGTLTLTQITRAMHGHWSRAEMKAARQEVGDFIEFARSHRKGQNRPSGRATLTLRGRVAAAMLAPAFKPTRLAPSEVRAGLEALILEHDVWALQIVKDAEDAHQWREHERRRKEADRQKEREREARKNRPKPKRGQSEWFKTNVLGEPSREPELFEAERTEPTAEPTRREKFGSLYPKVGVEQLRHGARIQVPSDEECLRNAASGGLTLRMPAGIGGLCPRCHGSLPRHCLECPLEGRTDFTPERFPVAQSIRTREGSAPVVDEDDPTTPTEVRIKAKARRLGYGAAIRPNGMLYGGERVIGFEEWDRLVSG